MINKTKQVLNIIFISILLFFLIGNILIEFNFLATIFYGIVLFLIWPKNKYSEKLKNKIGHKWLLILNIVLLFAGMVAMAENKEEEVEVENKISVVKSEPLVEIIKYEENIKNEIEENKKIEEKDIEENKIQITEKVPVKKVEIKTKPIKINPPPLIIQSKKIAEKFPEVKIQNLYLITKVVDGDTAKISMNGKIETIRIIGIDTPEIGSRLECFGNEAREKALQLLSGKKVKVEVDTTQGERDKYQRLLAYLIIDRKVDFGEEMIKQGYAYEYTYNKPYKNQSNYKIAQQYARENKKGLWAENACLEYEESKLTESSTGTKTANIETNISGGGVYKNSDGTCAIKGNISSKDDEKIYHTPNQQAYSRTKINTSKGEKWFCTESEALNAGWRKALQ